MMSVTEKQTVDELLQTTRVQIQVMAAEGVQQIVAQHARTTCAKLSRSLSGRSRQKGR